ncbi:MAG: TnpV protein [Oscillospiraceae bacterium]|nr:TnpV protein [Oscillospiraceae bacterium]
MNMRKSTPMICIIEEETQPLGRFGHMRDEFLRTHRNLERTMMFVCGELDAHLQEVDRLAWEHMDTLMEGLTANNPPPEKAKDFLGHVAHLNMLRAIAEEIVYRELIAV